uniref:Uncharacterized protein n=1 Tax=Meloidogyne javanica TaxID=6303 RepID=A0A915N6C2_MELJA
IVYPLILRRLTLYLQPEHVFRFWQSFEEIQAVGVPTFQFIISL